MGECMSKWSTYGWRVLWSILLVAGLAAPSMAQETTGTIVGLVTDQTGAILPGVTVVVIHIETGRTVEIVTGESGRYQAAVSRSSLRASA